MPKVPNLAVPSVNLPQMPSFSPPNWMTANYDSECVSALHSLIHAHMSLAWTWHNPNPKLYDPKAAGLPETFIYWKLYIKILYNASIGQCCKIVHCVLEELKSIVAFDKEHKVFICIIHSYLCKWTGCLYFKSVRSLSWIYNLLSLLWFIHMMGV